MAGPIEYTITGQRQTQDWQAGQGFQPAVEVFFTTKSGFSGSVKVPQRIYGADVVRERIGEYVAKVCEVEGIC